MDTSLFKLALTSQTIFGAIQLFVVFVVLGGVLGALQFYHANDRLTFSCSLKPDDFTKQLCYDKYTSTMSPWLIPRDMVAIIYSVLCFCWICFLIYSAVTRRQIKRDQGACPSQRQTQWGKLSCIYNIHVVRRLVFLGVMIGVFCGSQTLNLPYVFECTPRIPQTNKTVISVNQTETDKMQCNDLHYKEKSNLNFVILGIVAFVMTLGIFELLQLKLTGKEFPEMLLGNVFEEGDNFDSRENLLPPAENNVSGET